MAGRVAVVACIDPHQSQDCNTEISSIVVIELSSTAGGKIRRVINSGQGLSCVHLNNERLLGGTLARFKSIMTVFYAIYLVIMCYSKFHCVAHVKT